MFCIRINIWHIWDRFVMIIAALRPCTSLIFEKRDKRSSYVVAVVAGRVVTDCDIYQRWYFSKER